MNIDDHNAQGFSQAEAGEIMAHLIRVPGQARVSLETLHVLPGQPLKIGVWGWTQGLKLVPTRDSGWNTTVLAQANDTRRAGQSDVLGPSVCKAVSLAGLSGNNNPPATQFTFTAEGKFRIELRKELDVWDWLRVACSTKPAKASEAKIQGSGKLNVHVVWATANAPDADPLPHYLTVAHVLLAKYGFQLAVTPAVPWYGEPRIRGFEDGVVCQKDFGNLQGLAAAVAKLPEYSEGKRVVVVMANARQTIDAGKDDGTLAGQTVTQEYGAPGNPFIVLNVNCRSLDGATLVHELGHAAGFCDHSTVMSHVMSYGPRRNELPKGRVDDFQRAFFRTE